MTIVCVNAHPDDEMRFLGTLLRYHAAGRRIAFVCVTTGDKGLPDSPGTDATQIRTAEMQSVAAEFDAEVVLLGHGDGLVVDGLSLRRDLIATLRRLDASVILTHWTDDYNSDHRITARATVDAALFTSAQSFEPDSPALAATPRIFHVDPGSGYGFEATHFVELRPDVVARKAELIRRHESQMAVMRSLRGSDYADEMAEEDRVRGRRLMVSAAEGFRPCLAERRIPWPSDLPGAYEDGSV